MNMHIQEGGDFDVVVCGCGVAGFCAAIQAARAGCSTAVVERFGMPGGIMTVLGNGDVAQFFAHHKQVIAGIGWEFVTRLAEMGYAVIPDMMADGPHWIYGVHVNIPAAAHLMDVMLEEAGVRLFYGQTLADVECAAAPDGMTHLESVLVTSKTGLRRLRAKMFIDCTGDGDLSVFAGAEYELGGGLEDCFLQPGTVRYYPDPTALSPEEAARADAILRELEKAGALAPGDVMGKPIRQILAARGNNINHVSGFNGADSDSKTRADIEGRAGIFRLMEALHATGLRIPIESAAPESAMRETRRILGDGYITAEDYVAARHYEDSIATSFYPIDLHRDGTGGIRQVFLTDGQVPEIPLSALIVRGCDNLYVAGRCASGDRLANSAYRVKASCMAMGQAVGAAAAVAVQENDGKSRGCALEHIKKILRENGAIVP